LVFSSVIFLFLFLPVVSGLYYILSFPSILKSKRIPRLSANLLLLIASLLFYAWGERLIVLVMLFSTAVDYFCGLIISGAPRGGPIEPLLEDEQRLPRQRAALIFSIITNLALLGFFKYFNFFADNFISAAAALGLPVPASLFRVILPFGISFYTFQSMSYTIDVYRGKTAATRSFVDFACFVTMFPQLIAGPIVRYKEIAAQLVERHINFEDLAYGVRRFVIGSAKKVIIANNVAAVADRIFAIPSVGLTPAAAWLGAVSFTLQIYFDFSGYSDMAIGLGRMFGFRLPENFNYPYISRSFREYWTRWHITLATWFRDYLYFPLGGSRASLPRTYLNLFVIFFLCGLWHGASWTFVIWGLGHGVLMFSERLGFGKILERTWAPLSHAYFLLFTLFLKVLFRSESFEQAAAFLSAMVGFSSGNPSLYHIGVFLNPEIAALLLVGILFSTPLVPAANKVITEYLERMRTRTAFAARAVYSLADYIIMIFLLVFSAMWLAAGTYEPFIYFRF